MGAVGVTEGGGRSLLEEADQLLMYDPQCRLGALQRAVTVVAPGRVVALHGEVSRHDIGPQVGHGPPRHGEEEAAEQRVEAAPVDGPPAGRRHGGTAVLHEPQDGRQPRVGRQAAVGAHVLHEDRRPPKRLVDPRQQHRQRPARLLQHAE